MIEIRRASIQDALVLARTRRIVWEQTYRGIYPDEMLDEYDMEFHIRRDSGLLSVQEQHFFLFMDGENCVGYFSFGPCTYGRYKDFDLCLNSLYVCDGYKGMGLGRAAFAAIRNYGTISGQNKFFCGCNVHNIPAQQFYRHMGGRVGNISAGHENRAEDIIHFEFDIGELS